ncbi:MAG: hypothetical protein ACFCUX_08205 [Candidatus Methylacidiphilales bacterium]
MIIRAIPQTKQYNSVSTHHGNIDSTPHKPRCHRFSDFTAEWLSAPCAHGSMASTIPTTMGMSL